MVAPSDLEPQLDWDDIQGNVLGGFNKDHQTILGFTFGGKADGAKRFLAGILDWITPLHEVVLYKGVRRERILAEGAESADMAVTWVAAAFSFNGLKQLAPSADQFVDAEFRAGLPDSSSRLGDPAGSYQAWKIGGPGNIPDLLLIVAADRNADAQSTVQALLSAAASNDLVKIYSEEGHNLSFYSNSRVQFAGGHEHFGFKDGVSQPGIRGILPDGSFLTPRLSPGGDDGSGPELAAPGKPLICAGQFILGLAQQLDVFPRQAGPKHPLGTETGAVAPAWARNGSFLVFRRLRQNVPGFRRFVAAEADRIADPSTHTDRLAAMFVGRWPSGAPLIRTPFRDDRTQTKDSLINAFAFGADNGTLSLPNDSQGQLCPVAAHIRKVNPRDEDTDQGSASATLLRRILRRGIPYGPPLPPGEDDATEVDRGLLFLSYQSSINQQFEFLSSQWMNSGMLPRNPSAIGEGLGFDMLIGQNTAGRTRFAYIPGGTAPQRISTEAFSPKDWVVPTGGGYFFAPSISNIRTVLASQI